MASFKKVVRSAAGAVVALALLCAAALGAQDARTDDIALPDKAVTGKVLDNGLTVLARTSPPGGLAAIDLKILAGSSLEGRYLGSGISHLVEHMVFKGTGTRGPGDIEREIKSYGGFINGSTSGDLTSYRIILPSQYLAEALAILKDMLLNASFDETELAKEKEVILKEIRMNDDEPQSRLVRRLYETAYIRHPYRFPPIGYMDSFKALGRSDVVDYYDTMYVPNRIVLTIVGGIDEPEAIAKAEEAFKDFRRPNYGAAPAVEAEPPQPDTRRLDEESRANLAYMAMGFHSTSIHSPDLYALDVLAMILGRGDNSRLNARLVKEDRTAYSVSVWNATPNYPGLFTIYVICDRDKAGEAEQAILREIGRIKEAPVTDTELAGAKRMALGDFIDSLQTVDGQADGIGESYILTGGADFARHYVNGIQSVTAEDVRSAASRYLTAPNSNIVRLLPAVQPAGRTAEAPVPSPDTIRKETLPNGLRILVRRDPRTPVVSITAAMLGGLMAETASDNGISNLAASMLLKGTAGRDESRIQGFIEQLGGTITPFSGFNAFGLKITVLKPDIGPALEILKDVLSGSIFPQDQIDRQKRLIAAAIREEDDDIFGVGMNALRKILYGDSPYGLRYLGKQSSVASLDRQAITGFAGTYCVANNMVISISGDIDPGLTIDAAGKLFADIKRRDLTVAAPVSPPPAQPAAEELTMQKEQSLVMAGYITVPLNDPDRYTLEVLSSVLSGYSGRLFTELRNNDPLAYTLGCFQRSVIGSGFFVFYVATTGENVGKVRAGLLGELEKVRASGVTDGELARAKRELLGARRILEQTNGFFSFTSAVDELYGLGHDNLYRYDAAIEKVTNDDIVRVARKHLAAQSLAELSINPQ